MITLESFKVLRKLSVKNIHIEPRKVKAAYYVEKLSGETTSFELLYSYEHPYFSKNNPVDVNMASMMLAQVALNYGLFFETIEFDGLYDKSDQQFLKDMMENTSREILINKLLIYNEFLKSPFENLQADKREHYTQAKLLFTNTQFENLKLTPEESETDLNKYAILSSGGKDSLLTYG
ncbi:hypothetical protein ACFLZA_03335, partial [Candidatus Neomarinimicrobiota bacterium]